MARVDSRGPVGDPHSDQVVVRGPRTIVVDRGPAPEHEKVVGEVARHGTVGPGEERNPLLGAGGGGDGLGPREPEPAPGLEIEAQGAVLGPGTVVEGAIAPLPGAGGVPDQEPVPPHLLQGHEGRVQPVPVAVDLEREDIVLPEPPRIPEEAGPEGVHLLIGRLRPGAVHRIVHPEDLPVRGKVDLMQHDGPHRHRSHVIPHPDREGVHARPRGDRGRGGLGPGAPTGIVLTGLGEVDAPGVARRSAHRTPRRSPTRRSRRPARRERTVGCPGPPR